ncbi:MAG: hypothetical protein VYC55_14055 [Pseudomonadota bacterium]|nr:hypothetical protein [Pseudomonadota bacterium]
MAARFGGLKHIKPVRVIFSDAGYGRWTDEAWKHYLSKHPACSFVLLTRVWDKPWHNTRRFLRGNFRKVIPANIELYEFPRLSYTHSTIGNQAITWAYEAADTTLRVSVESVVRR